MERIDCTLVPMHDTPAVSTATTTNFSFLNTAAKVYSNQSTKFFYAKYDRTSPVDVVPQCNNLSNENKSTLLTLLQTFSRLFSGNTGYYVYKKFYIHLKDPNTPPILCNLYPVPIVHKQVFKKE